MSSGPFAGPLLTKYPIKCEWWSTAWTATHTQAQQAGWAGRGLPRKAYSAAADESQPSAGTKDARMDLPERKPRWRRAG